MLRDEQEEWEEQKAKKGGGTGGKRSSCLAAVKLRLSTSHAQTTWSTISYGSLTSQLSLNRQLHATLS